MKGYSLICSCLLLLPVAGWGQPLSDPYYDTKLVTAKHGAETWSVPDPELTPETIRKRFRELAQIAGVNNLVRKVNFYDTRASRSAGAKVKALTPTRAEVIFVQSELIRSYGQIDHGRFVVPLAIIHEIVHLLQNQYHSQQLFRTDILRRSSQDTHAATLLTLKYEPEAYERSYRAIGRVKRCMDGGAYSTCLASSVRTLAQRFNRPLKTLRSPWAKEYAEAFKRQAEKTGHTMDPKVRVTIAGYQAVGL